MKPLAGHPGARLSFKESGPDIYQAVVNLDRSVRHAGLERRLQELVKVRASQLNRCAFCLDMHCREARALGETQSRLDQLAAWRESPLFSAKERSALALTEAVTLLPVEGVPDAVYEDARQHFEDMQLAALLGVIVTINVWNRIAVGTRMTPPDSDASRGNTGVAATGGRPHRAPLS